jgi:hypothetical protein
MNTVIVMAVSRDRLPHPTAFRAEHASDFNELCQLVASHIALVAAPADGTIKA